MELYFQQGLKVVKSSEIFISSDKWSIKAHFKPIMGWSPLFRQSRKKLSLFLPMSCLNMNSHRHKTLTKNKSFLASVLSPPGDLLTF